MDYKTMADEYRTSAEQILNRIEILKSKKRKLYGAALNELNYRIKVLEEMYIDCNYTAKIMYKRADKAALQEGFNA